MKVEKPARKTERERVNANSEERERELKWLCWSALSLLASDLLLHLRSVASEQQLLPQRYRWQTAPPKFRV